MGRYVVGDFDWKFAFGDQDSTFGEVLELICEETDSNCNRYVGTKEQGEQVELYIENAKELKKAIKKFVGNVKKMDKVEEGKWCHCKLKKGNDYWNKLMMKKFLKEANLKDFETLNFYVEY